MIREKTTKTPAVVGIIKRKQIWETVKQESWYHIPVRSAPNNIRKCRYLAFYFPKFFDVEQRYQIVNYAEVRKIEVFKRIELFPAATRHQNADNDYYKLSLGNLQSLPKAIPSRVWRRIVFIPTSLEKLFTASEINDVYDTSPLEDTMYERLKLSGIHAERQFYVFASDKQYCLDFGIFCREGNIDVECDGETYHNLPDAYTRDRRRNNELTSHGWRVLRFGTKDIKHDIKGCVNTITRLIDHLGGTTEE